jgi:hypothetical protein
VSNRLLVLLQGGLGNQLMQWVLGQTLATVQGLDLQLSPLLLTSRMRAWRGVTPRSFSSLLPTDSGPAPMAWDRHLPIRCAARSPWHPSELLTDQDLLPNKVGDPGKFWFRRRRWLLTHATSPLLWHAQCAAAWQQIASTLQLQPTPSLFVHVRRSDYLNRRSGFFPLPAAYFRLAIDEALRSHPWLDQNIWICSDDLDWCANNLNDPRWRLHFTQGTPEKDLASMASAEVLITSNSSLSAVAAHLGQLQGAMSLVIAPDRWLRSTERPSLGDLRKPGWEVIPVVASCG